MNPKAKALSKQGAPTPFQMVGGLAKQVGRSVNSSLSKGAQAIMASSVRVGKNQDAKMQDMSRKAKAGEFNK